MASVVFSPSILATPALPAELLAHPIYGARPQMRGRSHQIAAIASIPIGLHLVTNVADPTSRRAALVYAATWTLMFTTSALYHRLAASCLARFWMRRLDHSMILCHMAGVTTPIALHAVGGTLGLLMLILAWSIAGIGVLIKLTTLTAEHDPWWLVPALGWLPLLAVPTLFIKHGVLAGTLLLAATFTYCLGAACFHRKSPDPIPTVFGYHEVWHAATIVAGCFQLLLTAQILSA